MKLGLRYVISWLLVLAALLSFLTINNTPGLAFQGLQSPNQTTTEVPSPAPGAPWLKLSDARAVSASAPTAAPSGKPLSLAAADLNGDLAPELLAGFSGPQGGWLALYPGSPDLQGDSPFLPQAQRIDLPQPPTWLGSGDFNGDGFGDVVAAGAGAAQISLLLGDGSGGLGEPQSIPLPGGISAMTAGELDRQDGLLDVAVALQDGQVLVFGGGPGGFDAPRYRLALPSPAIALAIGQLDEHFAFDLAALTATELHLLSGRDQLSGAALPSAQIERISLGFSAAALALGDFQPGDQQQTEIAVLASDGSLRLYDRRGQALQDSPLAQLKLPVTAGARPSLLRAKTSTLPGDDLLYLDGASPNLHYLNASFAASQPQAAALAVIETGAAAQVALPVRLNGDALSDLVYLTSASAVPQYSVTTPLRTFVVNTTWDSVDDDDIGDGDCNVASFLDGSYCTLRAAIQEANASAGLDEIQLNFKYVLSDPLPQITEALIMNGMNLAGEINGGSASGYGLQFVSAASTIQSIKLREFDWPAIYFHTGGDHQVNFVQIGNGNLGRGILISTNGNTLYNNTIIGNQGDGVAIINADNNTLRNNQIGLLANGSASPNQDAGVYLFNADNTVIGGASTQRNIIANNYDSGIQILGGSSGTLVQSNYIGLQQDGATPAGNTSAGGVYINNAPSTTIGSAVSTYRNVISGNLNGVSVAGNATPGALIRYNYIGTNASATAGVSNSLHGVKVTVTGSANFVQVKDNVIGGEDWGGHGVYLYGQANPVECIAHAVSSNFIGTDAAATTNLGVGMDGIHVEGVRCAAISQNTVRFNDQDGANVSGSANANVTLTNNTLSSNGSNGIELNTSFNTLTGNIASGNTLTGIAVYGSSNTLTNNAANNNGGAGLALLGDDNLVQGPNNSGATISNNAYEGVVISGNGNTLLLTYITSNTAAGVSISGDDNYVGSDSGGNLINGNAYGVELAEIANGNQVIDNSIGVEADGVTPAGNAFAGVRLLGNHNTIGGASEATGNVIADSPAGVLLQAWAANNTIRNNLIGTTAAGSSGLPNSAGVKIEAGLNNAIHNNRIAYNGDGVLVLSGTGNQIYANRIYNSIRLGIDLLPSGVTANDDGDLDDGANRLQNFPVLATAGNLGSQGRVRGSLNGLPLTTYIFHFYSSPSCDANGHGEGQVYVGTFNITSDANGNLAFDAVTGLLTLNEYITATATDPNGNTSEFSRCVRAGVLGGTETITVNSTADAVDANLGDGLCDSNAGLAGDQCTLRAAIQTANTNVGANTILLPGGEYLLSRAGTSENAAATGDLDITGDLTINGAGAHVTIVDANNLDRVLEIRNSAVVSLLGVTLEGGNPGNSAGGGLLVNSGCTVTLEAVTVQNNLVGASAGGGGIYNAGTLTANNSAVVNNQAGMNGGGLYQFGGSSAWLNSTFSGNQTAGSGGGIAAESTTLSLGNVTVAYNAADTDANGHDGGGLYQSGSTFSLQNSILSANTDGSLEGYPNGHADCIGTYTSTGYNLLSDQAKLNDATPAGCILSGGTGDTIGGFWLLYSYTTYYAGLEPTLELNGGTTPSHSPIASSAGISVDRGNPADPGSGGGACELIDQRGQPRPLDGGTDGIARCDRGAVEHIPVTISINDVTVAEGGVAEFVASLSESVQIAVSVQYAVSSLTASAGSDFTAVSGTLTFPAGTITQTIAVTTLTDTFDEADETFAVTLSSPTYVFLADSSGLGTILDSSPQPSILINDATVAEGASGSSATASFNVTLNSPSGKTVSVAYQVVAGSATASEDYLPASGTLSFAPGVTTQSIAVTVLGDNLQEGSETFTVQLSNPINATLGDSQGAGTISDDDTPSISIGDAEIFEEDANITMNFIVRLSIPSTGSISVNYITSPGTAVSGGDYVHTLGTLTFAPGVTAVTLPVTIVGDNTAEATETFTVSLNTPTGGAILGDSSAIGTIQDDESALTGTRKLYLPMVVRN